MNVVRSPSQTAGTDTGATNLRDAEDVRLFAERTGHASLTLEPAHGLARQRDAARDVVEGFRLWRLAITLGWLDIKLRYRGSTLGPFWLTLSTAVMVGALGIVWGTLFGVNERQYLPFLGLSLVLWTSGIQAVATDGCSTFIQAEQTLRSVRIPYSVYVIRTLTRNLIALAHNVVVPIGVFSFYDAWPGADAAWALPGVVLWIVDGFAVATLLGTVSARFRDLPPIIGSLLQIAFYVTPVLWKPSQLSHHYWWMDYNPFESLLEVVRAPLLGSAPTLGLWGMALGWSALLCVGGWFAFVRARARLAFWI